MSLLATPLLGLGTGYFAYGRWILGSVWSVVHIALSFAMAWATFRGAFSLFVVLAAALVLTTVAFIGAALVRPAGRVPGPLAVAGIWLALVLVSAAALPGIQVESFKIPSGSMSPSVLIGDHVVVDRSGLELHRGDIAVFSVPNDASKDYIKRIVGLPGDTVEITEGRLAVNGDVVEYGEGPEVEIANDDCSRIRARTVLEVVYGKRYETGRLLQESTHTDGRWVVPDDHLFFLGDNRDNSVDSRHWGPIPGESVKGKALYVYFSWDRCRGAIRTERIGMRFD